MIGFYYAHSNISELIREHRPYEEFIDLAHSRPAFELHSLKDSLVHTTDERKLHGTAIFGFHWSRTWIIHGELLKIIQIVCVGTYDSLHGGEINFPLWNTTKSQKKHSHLPRVSAQNLIAQQSN